MNMMIYARSGCPSREVHPKTVSIWGINGAHRMRREASNLSLKYGQIQGSGVHQYYAVAISFITLVRVYHHDALPGPVAVLR